LTGDEPGGENPLPRIVFAALVIACFAAFFITQRLKHTPTAIQKFELAGHFAPSTAGPHETEPISFKLAQADEVTVTIIDLAGNTVATLLHDHPVVRYKQFSLLWNGHRGVAAGYSRIKSAGGRTILAPRNRGPLARPGEYRVLVDLVHQHREVPSPRNFILEAR
jgi:hypothetical protein